MSQLGKPLNTRIASFHLSPPLPSLSLPSPPLPSFRSHSFEIRKRPEELEGETISNLNVRGKRGNIVQTYPGVEYDFVPNSLLLGVDAYVHIQ